ncbi:MAG: 23S rRNA (pseudouridine(1915)-N(3))-methyltransferase RlmH, partial [Clostridia bacterium]|nr:23S rRNA (pseudouridine(1915)-N(3))-methyltransferase RlmH [Clostridia bacterium]
MLNVTLITVGNLKESYLREAAAEYEKRLNGFCKLDCIQLKEVKLPDDPTASQISAALTAEGKQILASIPPRAYRIALCVEGQQLSSEQLAQRLEEIGQTHGSLCLIIGSSYGIAPEVKAACDFRLSVSKLTFPHKLM